MRQARDLERAMGMADPNKASKKKKKGDKKGKKGQGTGGVPIADDGHGPDVTRSITSTWQKDDGEGSEAGVGFEDDASEISVGAANQNKRGGDMEEVALMNEEGFYALLRKLFPSDRDISTEEVRSRGLSRLTPNTSTKAKINRSVD